MVPGRVCGMVAGKVSGMVAVCGAEWPLVKLDQSDTGRAWQQWGQVRKAGRECKAGTNVP